MISVLYVGSSIDGPRMSSNSFGGGALDASGTAHHLPQQDSRNIEDLWRSAQGRGQRNPAHTSSTLLSSTATPLVARTISHPLILARPTPKAISPRTMTSSPGLISSSASMTPGLSTSPLGRNSAISTIWAPMGSSRLAPSMARAMVPFGVNVARVLLSPSWIFRPSIFTSPASKRSPELDPKK